MHRGRRRERRWLLARSILLAAALAVMVLGPLAAPAAHGAPAMADLAASRIDAADYRSAAVGGDRHILIYVPAAYDAHPAARFPVLYLRHGGGQGAASWPADGDAAATLDRLIAAGTAVPMIVVFTEGTIPAALGSPYDPPGLAAAGHELIDEVIPLVEARYRVQPDRAHRALAGLSMGAGQSFAMGQTYADRFGALGIFSAGTFGIVRPPAAAGAAPAAAPAAAPPVSLRPFDPARDAAAMLADPAAFNRLTPLIYVAVGDRDPRAVPTAAAVATMRAAGVRIVTATFPGAHEWTVWRAALADFVPRLFRPSADGR